MTHAEDALQQKIQKLSDVELAILLCLIANEHCIIRADIHQQGRLALEIGLACMNTFGLRHTVLECSEQTSLDDFTNGVLIDDDEPGYFQTGSRRSKDEVGSKCLSCTMLRKALVKRIGIRLTHPRVYILPALQYKASE
jgi:hypothetical protein